MKTLKLLLRTSFFILLGYLLFVSCRSIQEDQVELIALEGSLSPIPSLANFVSSCELIELSDEVPLPNCSKVLLNDKDKTLIFLTNAGIFCYASDGSYIGKYGEIGRGPGEYLKIYDICFNSDGSNLLCLDHENNVMVYSCEDLSFIKKISTSAKSLGLPNGTGIAPSKEGSFFIFVPNPRNYSDPNEQFNCLYEFNLSGEKIGEFIPRKDFNIDMTSLFPFFTQNGGSYFLRPQENENLLYELCDGEITPFAHVSFGSRNAKPLFCFKDGQDPWINMSDFLSGDFYKMPFNYFESDSFRTISAFGPSQAVYTFILDKSSGKSISWNIGDNPVCSPLFFVGTENDYFYVLFDKFGLNKANVPDNSPDALLRYLLEDRSISLKETGNPILIKIKFKNF